VRFSGLDEFGSLQAVVLLGAVGVFPALFFLVREIGFGFVTAVCGAAVYAFLPNVWVYGGTGFGDVPSATLSFAACALILRGRHRVRSYVLGVAVLAIVGGIRPAHVAIGIIPAIVVTWRYLQAGSWRAPVAAILLGSTLVVSTYAAAAFVSGGVRSYLSATRNQGAYIEEVESFRNPGRPPLSETATMFFLFPMDQPGLMAGVLLLATISLSTAIDRRRWQPGYIVAVFAPFAIAVWLNLNIDDTSRYAIPYLAVQLAADGLRVLGRSAWLQSLLTAALVGAMATSTWPALERHRTTDSPISAALSFVRRQVLPVPDLRVYVDGGIRPQADFLLPLHRLIFFEVDKIALFSIDSPIIDLRTEQDGTNFVWPRTDLWDILRRLNFEVSVAHSVGPMAWARSGTVTRARGPTGSAGCHGKAR
jgi:hypothetical protein